MRPRGNSEYGPLLQSGNPIDKNAAVAILAQRTGSFRVGTLTRHGYNNIVVTMIPTLVAITGSPWDVLPPGIHQASLADVERAFTYNPRRRTLFVGLLDAVAHLFLAGCSRILLDGSYVSAKPVPADYDACWDPDGVDFAKLDAVFDDFANGRANQKARFGGEFFPSTLIEADSSAAFVEFFQIDRFSGKKKGILAITLATDETVARRVKL